MTSYWEIKPLHMLLIQLTWHYTGVRWALINVTAVCCPYKKAKRYTKIDAQGRLLCEDSGILEWCIYKPKRNKNCLQIPEAGMRQESLLLQSLGRWQYLRFGLPASRIERINLFCFKQPRLWYSTMAPSGN